MSQATAVELGQRIFIRRRVLRLKQEALASAVGMSQTTISRIETGAQPVNSFQLETIAKALQCSPVYLTGGRP